MAESSHNNHPPPSKVRPRSTGGGEIVEVQGGHIVRSTGRKDRHSKVCTAKGTRDRRVRLAAHTAIQFYDVQDRLGYDRPSKAVDWLIKKAQAAIDELAQLPPWHPTDNSVPNPSFEQEEAEQSQPHLGINASNGNNPTAQSSSFLPPSLDSDAIADTIKSFFPVGASASASASTMEFQTYPTHDLLSRNNTNNNNNPNNQDLRLSLHSFQDPILIHNHQRHDGPPSSQTQVLLSGIPLGFDGWTEQQQQPAELSHFQRLPAWNAAEAAAAGYMFNMQQVLGQNQFILQRGPLQSSNTPSVRAWMDPPPPPSAIPMDHNYQQHPSVLPFYHQSSFSGGFSEFRVPARIQGDQEEHDGYADNKPSSASSDSRH